MYFNQLLLAARKVHVVYSDQLLGAALCIYFISNHDMGVRRSFSKRKPIIWCASGEGFKEPERTPKTQTFKIINPPSTPVDAYG